MISPSRAVKCAAKSRWTAARYVGAALRSTARPLEVRAAKADRPSSGFGSRATSPALEQLVDDPADPGAADSGDRAELAHGETAFGRGVELQQDVVPRQRQAMGLLQLAVEARHQCGVHLEQRAQVSATSCGMAPRYQFLCVRTHFDITMCVRT